MAKYTKELRPPPTPKQPKPWGAPPPPAWGDANPNAIYQAVGLALTNWELLEHALGQIFVALIASRSYEALRAYSSVVANSARLEMTRGASEAFFLTRDGDDYAVLKTRVNDLLEAIEGFAKRRNEIAHGVIGIMFADDDPDFEGAEPPSSSWVLTPSLFAKRNRKMFRLKDSELVGFSPAYQYSSVEINAISAKFRELRPVAERLAAAIRRQRHLERKELERKASVQKLA